MTRLYLPGVAVELAGRRVVTSGGTEGLRVSFRISKSMSKVPDVADVAIYNLGQHRTLAMQSNWSSTGRAVLQIECGYAGALVRLFRGDVRRMTTRALASSPEIVTQASADEAGDALIEARTPPISTSGLTVRNMVDVALVVLSRAGEQIDEHPSVAAAIASEPIKASRGFNVVAIGRATDLLDEAARTLGVRWFVRNGLLFFARNGIPLDGRAIQIPRSQWLEEPTDDGSGVVRVSTLLNPTIEPGRQIQVIGMTNPTSIDVLRAEVCEYAGDTHVAVPWRVTILGRRPLS